MKVLILSSLFLLIQAAMADTNNLVRELCPYCQTQTDGTLLLPNGNRFFKMRIIRFDRKQVALTLVGETDSRGKVTSNVVTFKNQYEREHFSKGLKHRCWSFLGYEYYASGFNFSQGSHRSGPDEVTKAKFDLTCHNDETSMDRVMNFFKKTLGRNRSTSSLDSDRSSGKDVPIKFIRVPSNGNRTIGQ